MHSLKDILVDERGVSCWHPVAVGLRQLADKVLAGYRLKTDGSYDRWFPDRPDVSTIDTLGSYDALFILMSGSTVWAQQPSAAPSSTSLALGWNSVCYVGEAMSTDEATATVASQLGILYALGSSQSWSRYVPDRPGLSNIAHLEPYDAVLMLVTERDGAIWMFEPKSWAEAGTSKNSRPG